jgi:hypothetical protein
MLIAWFLRRVFRLRRDLRQLASYRRILAALPSRENDQNEPRFVGSILMVGTLLH